MYVGADIGRQVTGLTGDTPDWLQHYNGLFEI